jgi:hypothetical protein
MPAFGIVIIKIEFVIDFPSRALGAARKALRCSAHPFPGIVFGPAIELTPLGAEYPDGTVGADANAIGGAGNFNSRR